MTASDWSFYTEKVRQQKYDVDTAALRPWFEAERVLKLGVFGAANALYGITFTERTDLIGYHPDVRVFEVKNDDGSPVGLYLLDLYTRDSKRGGAWMNSLVSQNTLLDQPVVVTNNLNVPKPAAGEPTLLTFDEVQHVLPRVRARAARALRAGDLPEARGHECVPRLRRVPEPGERDVDAVARGARRLRDALRDRRADRRRGGRAHPRVGDVQRRLRDERVPRRGAARPGLAHPVVGRRPPPSPTSRRSKPPR